MLLCLNYQPDCQAQKVFHEHKRWGDLHSQGNLATFKNHNKADPGAKLRVGYVSPDFRMHSVGFFFEPVLRNHNTNKIETICYANVRKPDHFTDRLKSLAHIWRDISQMDDNQAADLIRHDRVNILVDLAGHTAGNRLLIFAKKPAPIQITWLGYPNTTGLKEIDYRFTDPYTDPLEKNSNFYTEKLIRLENSFFCFPPPLKNPNISPLPALKNGFITFGAFHDLAKISTNALNLWAKILLKIPYSKIIIQSKALTSKQTGLYLINFFKSKGIDSSRVELTGYKIFKDYLKLHNKIDLMLDTFPWNGHTTSCHALWMGVPILTLAGETHASRLCTGLMSNIGLPEFSALSNKGYIEKAVELSKNIELLASIRKHLRKIIMSSKIWDGKLLTENIEDIYEKISKFKKNDTIPE